MTWRTLPLYPCRTQKKLRHGTGGRAIISRAILLSLPGSVRHHDMKGFEFIPMPRATRAEAAILLQEAKAVELVVSEAEVPPETLQEYWSLCADL